MRKILHLTPIVLAAACTPFAPLPPMVTFGGPADQPKAGRSKSGAAIGYGGVGFGEDDDDGYGAQLHHRYGVTDEMAIGIDVLGYRRSGDSGASLKAAIEQIVGDRIRIDVGLGGADDEFGNSLNADVAAVLGFNEPLAADWAWYGALRVGGALGYDDDWDRTPPPGAAERLHDALLPMVSLGGTHPIGQDVKLLVEGGWGRLFREGEDGSTDAFYLTTGFFVAF
jgi:hypothetical protein